MMIKLRMAMFRVLPSMTLAAMAVSFAMSKKWR